MDTGWTRATGDAARLGESPMWHPREQALYYCDIAAHELRRLDPATGTVQRWHFDSDVACCVPAAAGGLILAMRSGMWRFDPATGGRRLIAEAPYDPAVERFNDGKCDAQGRFWCGTIYEPRQPALASLYCLEAGALRRVAGEVTVSNGLSFSPDGTTMYWADTTAHTVYALDLDAATGAVSPRRVFARFARRDAAGEAPYGGRPDGATVDARGHVWIALYEGARLVELDPQGIVVRSLPLPVQCPTMPCFGGPDLRTLYVTSASQNRSAEELARQPWAGQVLAMRMDVPGLPARCYAA